MALTPQLETAGEGGQGSRRPLRCGTRAVTPLEYVVRPTLTTMDGPLTTSFAGIAPAFIGATPPLRVPSASQRGAIEAAPQPLLVRAGPGAGKTYCLIERIRFLVENRGFDPARICVFTFTNKAAGEIASRLDSDLGPRVESVKRGTIHSFCSELLREYGDQVGLQEGFGIADELYQLALLRRLKVPRKLHKSVLDAFARYRFRGEPLGHRYEKYYDGYRRATNEQNMVDFDGLLLKTAELFRIASVASAV